MNSEFEKDSKDKIIRVKRKGLYELFGKRLLDVFVSLMAILVLTPVFLVIAVLIKIDSKGSIIYKQRRVGQGTKEFFVFKFRTMVINADNIGPTSTKERDPRVTKIGRFLRKLSMDELPQLINVLIGDMSIVGYRPGVKENYSDKDFESEIFNLKPGITGYAQINGRSALTKKEKRTWEYRYTKDISFITDFKIIYKTVKKVVIRDGAN